MGDVDWPAKARSSCQQAAEPLLAICGSGTKIRVRRNGSKRGAAASLEIGNRSFPSGVKSSCKDIGFDLAIPPVRHVFLKPSRKRSQLFTRQLCHRHFEFLNAHTLKIRLSET